MSETRPGRLTVSLNPEAAEVVRREAAATGRSASAVVNALVFAADTPALVVKPDLRAMYAVSSGGHDMGRDES